MATVVNTSWNSGSLGNKSTPTCVGVAGQGLPSAFYRAGGNLSVRLNDDGTVDINETSLTVEQSAISNVGGEAYGWGADTWWFHGLYISKSSFTLYDGPSGPSGYGAGVLAYNGGKISHQGQGTSSGNPSSHYSWLSGGSSGGWKRIANNIMELSHSSDYKHLYVYAGGLIDFDHTPTTGISITAARIELTSDGSPGIESLFDYYPWERYINDGFYSLNRNGGPSSQQSVGLFRYENGWQPVGNDLASRSDGQRYNNGWQKSPKSGKGAI